MTPCVSLGVGVEWDSSVIGHHGRGEGTSVEYIGLGFPGTPKNETDVWTRTLAASFPIASREGES